MARLKICHIITRLILGGAQQNTVLTCALLDRRKYDVLLVTGPETGTEGELHTEAQRLGVTTVIVPTLVRAVSPVADIRALLALRRLLLDRAPDVVHTHSSKAGMLGRAAARLARVPVVVHTVHGWSFHAHMAPVIRRAYALTERVMARRTHKLVVVTDCDREKGVRAGIGVPGQYVTIRSGVDLSEFRDGAPSPRLRDALGIPPGARVVGTVGRLSPQKDPRTFVKAAALVSRRLPEAYFVLVGDGPLRADVERLAEELRVADRLRITGIRRDVPDLMRTFDVFALASLWEGLPRVIPQAMSLGLPIVAANVDGVAEAIEHGISGMLVPPGNSQALADQIVQILTDRELARTLAQAGMARASQFDLSLMLRRLEELYDGLGDSTTNSRGEAAWRPALR